MKNMIAKLGETVAKVVTEHPFSYVSVCGMIVGFVFGKCFVVTSDMDKLFVEILKK